MRKHYCLPPRSSPSPGRHRVRRVAVTRVVAIKPTGSAPSPERFRPVTASVGETTTRSTTRSSPTTATSPRRFCGRGDVHEVNTAGTYRYRDALEPAERGTIVVKGPPPSVSIALSQGTVFYGAGVRLTGFISPGAANQDVQIWERPFGQASFVKQAELTTVTAGGYDCSETPQMLTEYQARWGNRQSAIVSVGVRPRMTFIRRAPWFVTSAKAGTSFAGHWVYVQRRSCLGQWVNTKKVRLGSSGARRFKVDLPRGRHVLRIFMTTNQAGAGYLWSHSRTIVVRKRTR